jgi:hypothetical protein
MPKLHFRECLQDSQELGSTNEHMVSQVFFTIDDKSTLYKCQIHQDAGESFSFEDSPLILTPPDQVQAALNYEEFRAAVETYYRMCVGKSLSGIRTSGASDTRMSNNRFIQSFSVDVASVNGSEDGGWQQDERNFHNTSDLFKGQFIGMFDKKGTPIHEGASVKLYHMGADVICKIVYVPDWAMFCLQWSDGYKNKFPMSPENFEVV